MPPRPHWAWMVLIVLLVLLLAGAVRLDRSTWPSLVGDEATYLMQAESLAWDFDLAYSRADYERFVARRGFLPEGLILQSGDGGAHITFGKPFFYALYLAPFVRLAPGNGPFVANALLLALAAFVASRVLARRIGENAPLWVSALVFASVSFAYTFWIHADLFLMCLAALALALAFDPRRRDDVRPRRDLLPWILAGGLLAVVAFSRPMYAALFLPALMAVPRRRRWRLGPALVGGGLAVLLVTAAVHQYLSDSWTSYGASRRGFYSYTGFPDVDFPAADWQDNLADWGNHAWLKPTEMPEKKLVASLLGWNVVYFLAGCHVGVLPYFLPAVLAFGHRPRRFSGWCLLAAMALVAAAFLWLRPFNFWGGGGAMANRYILPLYPALWFLPERPIHKRWIAAATLLAGLFMAPLWSRPLAFPLVADGAYGYVSPVANRLLPYETTQSHLKPTGREDVLHHGLWIKFLDRGVGASRTGEVLRLRDGGGAFLLGSDRPLAGLGVMIRPAPATVPRIEGAGLEESETRDGGLYLRLVLDGARARHPMWWTWEPFYLYRLKLTTDSERPLRLRLTPDRGLDQLPSAEPWPARNFDRLPSAEPWPARGFDQLPVVESWPACGFGQLSASESRLTVGRRARRLRISVRTAVRRALRDGSSAQTAVRRALRDGSSTQTVVRRALRDGRSTQTVVRRAPGDRILLRTAVSDAGRSASAPNRG